jgi:hypothetical protein
VGKWPHGLIGTAGTMGNAGEDELAIQTEQGALERDLPFAVLPI